MAAKGSVLVPQITRHSCQKAEQSPKLVLQRKQHYGCFAAL